MSLQPIFDNKGNGQLYIGPCCYNVQITEVTRDYNCYTEFKGYIFDPLNPHGETTVKHRSMDIERVIFNDPATIVIWKDGTKTVVKCQDGDEYDAEKGLALCISKKALGNKGNFNEVFKKWVPHEEREEITNLEISFDGTTLAKAFSKMSDLTMKLGGK